MVEEKQKEDDSKEEHTINIDGYRFLDSDFC
jgi:hypothetical protein